MVDQVLDLVEAHYMPRVSVDKERMKEKKLEAEELEKIQSKLSDPDNFGAVNPSATNEEKKQFKDLEEQIKLIQQEIKTIMDAVEDKVLDSELFLREAKCYFLLKENMGSQ